MLKLVISDDEGKTTVVPLVRDEITIGRKEGNTIRLTERNVSRKHAKLTRKDGSFVLEDLSSYNGIRLNGQKLEAPGPTTVKPGDQLVIGDYVLALQSDAAVEPAPKVNVEKRITPARLVMLTAPAPGAEYALTKDGMRIGRAEDLDVWVNHRSISREHAFVRMEGGAFEIVDNKSANGLRVDGKDVQRAALKSGALVELGQVRFRFVAPGEPYTFEADHAMVVDAPAPSGGAIPKVVAALILLGAAAVAYYIATASSEPESETAVVTPPEAIPLPTVPSATNSAEVSAAVQSCETAVQASNFAAALAAADTALTLEPAHAAARACRQRAVALQSEHDAFARGVSAMTSGDVATAFFAFEELPEGSALRLRSEVAQAQQAFIDHSLGLARASLRSDPLAAARHANAALSTPNVSAQDRTEAQQILRTARRANPAAASVMTGRVEDTTMSTSVATNMTVTMSTATVTPTMEETAPPAQGTCEPQTVLTQCSYQQRCVAASLRHCSGNARILYIRSEAHRQIGDAAEVNRLYEEILRRFPDSEIARDVRRRTGG